MKLENGYCIAESFAGDILPLELPLPADTKGIRWESADPAVVRLRDFAGNEPDCFETGVLAALLAPGETEVTAVREGCRYTCRIRVRPRRTAPPDAELQMYFGDFHNHTTTDHKRQSFLERGTEAQPENAMRFVRDEGFYDCMAVTDHASLVDRREYFRLFLQAEKVQTDDFILFPGTESEVDEDEYDRRGFLHRNSGEVVTFNACGFASVPTWKEYFEETSGGALTIGCFAHPQIFGYSCAGIWDFRPEEKTTQEMRERFRMIELGNGNDREANLINERVYSLMLDCGYRIGPALNSDCHGSIWGKNVLPGRTVLLAEGKSREAFLDALVNTRFYATENGDVKLRFSVNGHREGSTLPLDDEYRFRVTLGSFGENIPCTLLEVLSDGGETVYSMPLYGETELSFFLRSEKARYFYLRLWDRNGKRTWSAPVWTGRPCDEVPLPAFDRPALATDCIAVTASGCADKLANGDPADLWCGDSPDETAVFDLGGIRDITGIGFYPHMPPTRDAYGTAMENNARFPDAAFIETGDDGTHFKPLAQYRFRGYGGERILRKSFSARYVRIRLRSVGSVSRQALYVHSPVQMGEVTFYI